MRWTIKIMALKVAICIIAFSFVGVSMNVLNKEMLNYIESPIFIVTAQLIGGFAIVFSTSLCKTMQFGLMWTKWLPVPILILGMITTSMFGMQHATLGSFVVIRNLAPLAIAVLEWRILKTPLTMRQIGALLCIVAGAVLYERENAHSSRTGVCFLIANLVLVSVDRVVEKKLLHEIDGTKTALTLLNNAIGFPLLLVLFACDQKQLYVFPKIDERSAICLALTCINGVALNYLGMTVQAELSATEMSVLGCATKMSVILWGIVKHNDESTWVHIFAIALNMSGCFLYCIESSKRLAEIANETIHLIDNEEH